MENEKISAEEIKLAPETEAVEHIETETEMNPQTEKNDAYEMNEIKSFRSENSKVFKMSDGKNKAVFYPSPVHFFDNATEEFEEIDSCIVEEANGRHYKNKKNRFCARFSREKNDDMLFCIEDDTHRVTVMKVDNLKTIKKERTIEKRDCYTEAENNFKESIVFKDIIPDTDFEYAIKSNGVKEDIIIKKRADEYIYQFIIKCENVLPVYRKDEKKVSFYDEESKDEVFSIPAPFMKDAKGEISTDVDYDIEELDEENIRFTVIANAEWINSETRMFPVCIDPQINISQKATLATYSWTNGYMSSSSTHKVGNNISDVCNANRMYVQITMPTLPRNPRIKKAELILKQSTYSNTSGKTIKIGLYHVEDDIVTGTCTPVDNDSLIDFACMKAGTNVEYSFDITTLVDRINKSETSYQNFVIKTIDEDTTYKDYIELYGSSSSTNCQPTLCITYESNYAINSSYKTHTHNIGRFGNGKVDLQCGNLLLESDDFSWGGNRTPVTIKHLYNSSLAGYRYTKNTSIKLNVANFASMYLGYGWKLNLMQSMVAGSFIYNGTTYSGYIYTDENGEESYFKYDSSPSMYAMVTEDESDAKVYYNADTKTMEYGSYNYLFDNDGRLVSMTDINCDNNKITITYTSGRITAVSDGAGRIFNFNYNSSGYLTSIVAPDGTSITYTYSSGNLYKITYPNGTSATITSSSNRPANIVIKDDTDIGVYKVVYTYSNGRVYRVREYGAADGVFTSGTYSTYTYSVAAKRTTVQTTELKDTDSGETSNNTIKTVYSFNDDGDIIGEYVYTSDTGNVGVDGSSEGINPYSGDGGAKTVKNSNNMIVDSDFASLDYWIKSGTTSIYTTYSDEDTAKYGRKVLHMKTINTAGTNVGASQSIALPAGEYTFSAYVKVISAFSGTCSYPGAYICVKQGSTIIGISERIIANNDVVLPRDENEAENINYIRLIAPFKLSAASTVTVSIFMDGAGEIYADAPQLEKNPYATEFNLLKNGNFECSSPLANWTPSTGVYYVNSTYFDMQNALRITGDLDSRRYAYNNVYVKSAIGTRETFTLAGWAKGSGLVGADAANRPTFRLRAVFYYTDGSTEEHIADFSPCTEEWQYTSIQFAKKEYRVVNYLRIYCDYDYNYGTAYFDNIQLLRDMLETNLVYDDFCPPSYAPDQEQEEEEVFSEVTDAYGNNITETTFYTTTNDGVVSIGSTAIYRSFGYSSNGNDLIRETDARGNMTHYTVDAETSRNTEVKDRCGNIVAYEYDDAGRTTRVTNKNPSGTELASVSYAYDAFDNLTEITRDDDMSYLMAYNAYHNLESIGILGKSEKLVSYAYKNGNGRLKTVTYANGDTMKVYYNKLGQLTAEKWYDADKLLVAHYRYAYDEQGNIVRSIDMWAGKEYNYEYDDGHIVRATECKITVSGEIVTSKRLLHTVFYKYNKDGELENKSFVKANENTPYVEYSGSTSSTISFNGSTQNVTSRSTSDELGRKTTDELTLGSSSIKREYTYLAGARTAEHIANGKNAGSPTTQLVSKITYSDGRTIAYEYDAEDRITKVTDSVDGVTTYVYDALGQLVSETRGGTTVNVEYDNYGNITKKNGVTYTYGDSIWKDKLTSYGGRYISYDAQGNPTTSLGHTLNWEKGRQLKAFDSYSYTYNANGIRTGKFINGDIHEYTLDGTKILRETWADNSIIPLYDYEDSVCGIIYNSVPYYFVKNLQGDIISITNSAGTVVAKYTYDAWGVCTIKSDTSGVSIATINPFRYRGYYYDTEIGIYYLQSRYYDPAVGRFINADDVIYILQDDRILQQNIFTYCYNESVSRMDKIGTNSGYINNQSDALWKSVRLGFWGNVKDNGCGAIAIYNILYSYSKKITIKKVLSNLRWMYGEILYNNLGIIGISPISVTAYLMSKFMFTIVGGPITYFWGMKAELSNGIIVLYQHKGWNSSLHYVAGIRKGNGVGGLFRFYNDSYYTARYGKRLISIWKYIDLLRENGCKLIAFWGVSGKKGWW